MYRNHDSILDALRNKIAEVEEAQSELESLLIDLRDAESALENLEGRTFDFTFEF